MGEDWEIGSCGEFYHFGVLLSEDAVLAHIRDLDAEIEAKDEAIGSLKARNALLYELYEVTQVAESVPKNEWDFNTADRGTLARKRRREIMRELAALEEATHA